MGCSFKANQIDPKPWIEGTRINIGLRMLVAETIENDFIIAGNEGIPDLHVTGWRDALALGLERGRPQRFAPPGDAPSWQLILQVAEVALIPVDWGTDGLANLFSAVITYEALVFDPGNLPSGELKGQVAAKKPFQGLSDGSPLLADVIEQLTLEVVQRTAGLVERRLRAGEP